MRVHCIDDASVLYWDYWIEEVIIVKDDPTLVNFDQFTKLVKLPAIHVRTALRVLRKTPVPRIEDARQKRYRTEWVAEVREWIEKNLGGQ